MTTTTDRHTDRQETVARTASRMGDSRWRDPRLAIGIMLIALAVAGTIWVVSAATVRESVYVATRAVAPGEELAAADLAIAEVNLDGHAGAYLAVGALPAGAVATQPIAAGELVALGDTGRADQLTVRPVPIPLGGPIPAGLRVGGLVDLWLVPPGETPSAEEDAAPPAPRQLAANLVVREIDRDAGGLGLPGGDTSVHVLVPIALLPDVLAARSGPGTVSLVPVPSGEVP